MLWKLLCGCVVQICVICVHLAYIIYQVSTETQIRYITINEHISVPLPAEHMGHSHVLLATFEKVREMVMLMQTIQDKRTWCSFLCVIRLDSR